MAPTPAAGTRAKRAYRPSAERRAEIIAAAQEAFARATFSGARTRDIAEAAGVNQATLFKLFPTKERLFEEAVMQPLIAAMADMQDRIRRYDAAATPDEMANLAEESTRRHLADMERILPLLGAALFSETETGRRLFRDHLEPLIRERGEVLRPLTRPEVDPAFVGLASFGMMFAVALQRHFGTPAMDDDDLVRQFNRLATGGFARRPDATSAA
jgi:AcrR family transcriptional regulator